MNDHTTMIFKCLSLKGMSQADLSRLSKVPRVQINQILSHSRTMTVRQAVAISRVLKLPSARELLIAQVDWKLSEISH